MSNIISPDISIVPKYRNGIIGIFITIELILLTLVTFELYKLSIIVVSGVVGVFALYLFFNKPFLVLPTLLISILAGTIGSNNSSSQISFTDLLFPIVIAIFLIRTFYNSNEKSEPYNFIKAFYSAFLIWSLFIVFLAPDKSLALAYWRNYFAGFIIFLSGLAFIKNFKQIRFLIVVLVIWGIILAFIEFNAFISLGNASSAIVKVLLNKNLISTTWGRSNYFAAFYVLIIPITLGYLFSLKSKKSKSLLILALMFLFSGIVITLSRGGLLSLGVAVLIFISKVLKPKTFVPLVGLILLISIILLLNPLTLFIFKGLSTVDSNLSTYSRLNFYKDVWNTFLNNPITGVGFANLGHFAQFKITNAPASAHNIILGALGETGIIGTIFLIGTLVYAFVLSFRNYLKEKIESVGILLWSFFSAFAGVFLHSMMEPNFEGFQFAVMFWATLAAFLRLSELNDNEKLLLVNHDSTQKSNNISL